MGPAKIAMRDRKYVYWLLAFNLLLANIAKRRKKTLEIQYYCSSHLTRDVESLKQD